MTEDKVIIRQIEETIGKSLENKVKYEGDNIVELSLTGFEGKSIPGVIGELHLLRILNISSSNYEIIPESIGKLKQLREFIAVDTIN